MLGKSGSDKVLFLLVHLVQCLSTEGDFWNQRVGMLFVFAHEMEIMRFM